MALIETLTDNFDDNARNTSLWTLTTGTGTTAETGGQLVITPASNNPSATYDGYTSVSTYNLTSSQVTVEIPQGITPASGNEQVFSLQLDANNNLSMLLGGSNGILFRVKTAGSTSDTGVTRNDTSMRWWRIRESGGVVFHETSPNGNTWTVRRTSSVTFSITSLQVRIAAGTWQNVASPGSGIFDNLNVLGTTNGAWFTT